MDVQPNPEPEEGKAAGSEPLDDGNLIVVGVGASAGGLEAFTDLLKHLPASTGMAFVLVQHLDPNWESALSEILSKQTAMPLVQVEDGAQLERDHVYVIPPNTQMTVHEGMLRLEARSLARGQFHPIDHFFSSLAQTYRNNAVGVILSGTASDGTLGLIEIKAAGGITFAQDNSAKFDGMPRSAVAAGAVDRVLSPRGIAEELIDIGRHSRRRFAGDLSDEDGKTLHSIFVLLRKHHGVDFTEYKQPTIFRRLSRRMLVRNCSTAEEYLRLLHQQPEEITALFDDLLINVTEFFRDPDVLESAQRAVFPALLRDRRTPHTMRVWVPGCSSGEEVYSLAITIMEYLEAEDLYHTIQVFGTDISDSAIARARAGIYSERSLSKVSPERLRRYFSRTDGRYQICRAIRDICIFSRHDLAKDPPLSRMHLISCRNLLIYFVPALQKRVLATLTYALQPGGCLILGPSEALGSVAEQFVTLDEPNKIYCKQANVPPHATYPLDTGAEHVADAWWKASQAALHPYSPSSGSRQPDASTLTALRNAPAGVVVDETLRIREIRGDIAPFATLPKDAETLELLDVLHEHLRAPASMVVEQARNSNLTVVAEGVALGPGADAPRINISAAPTSANKHSRHFLILFRRSNDWRNQGAPPPAPVEDSRGEPLTPEQENTRLEQELRSTREYLQSVVEELWSANEEAQSANEELQSTNEELQTSKEELQASNEELHTVNAEMQSRNTELARLNDDLLNLLSSMNIPIVMTGADLRVRRFTPIAQKVLHLMQADVGQPVADLTRRINEPNLEEILQKVLDTLQPHEQEVQDQDGNSYLMRIRPYRTADHRIDGTVIQLLDVTDLKRYTEELRHARDYAEAIVDTVQEPLVVLDQDLAIQNANRAFYEVFRVIQSAVEGRSILEAVRGQMDSPKVRRLLEQISAGPGYLEDVEMELLREGDPRILLVSARRLQASERKGLLLMAFQDVTERKRAAEARYRRLFESARDGIILIEAETGNVMDVNPFTERLLGYGREQLLNRKFWDLEAVRNVPQMRAALQQIRGEGVHRFDDLRLLHRDGHELYTEGLANVYWEGERQSIQFHIRDMSERKKFERELQETQKLESLGLLAGGIAHDFNNLLTGILGNASMVYSDLPPNHASRIRLREIVQASERAAFLTRQMLAYAGRGRFVTEKLDLGELVAEISTLVRTSVPKTVELVLRTAPGLPKIEADPSQIQQVVMNLVINAAEAIGEGEVGTVEIRTSLRELDAREIAEVYRQEQLVAGPYVQLEVRDTGSGMSEDTIERIFDPFFTTKFTGRGLGLAAVQGIVRGHGGAIRVFSTPGHGTTFLILFPAKAGAVEAPANEHVPAVRVPPGSVALVVDDEETIRSMVTEVLSRAGMKVLTAETGEEGIEIFREHHTIISVVLLDLQMPLKGGDQVMQELKRVNPNVPVILSSGYDESEAGRRFPTNRPSGFLQKPYTSDRLLESIAAAMASRES